MTVLIKQQVCAGVCELFACFLRKGLLLLLLLSKDPEWISLATASSTPAELLTSWAAEKRKQEEEQHGWFFLHGAPGISEAVVLY